jgi:hypothetical protein
VVDFYTRGADFPATNIQVHDPRIIPVPILIGSNARKNQLVSFLLSLTDARVRHESTPFDHPEIFVPIDGRAPVSPGSRAGFLANTRMFQRIPETGAFGRPAEGLPPLGTFLNVSPFRP